MMATLTSGLVFGAFLGALVFVLRYLLVRWYETTMGRHVMAFMTVCLITLTLAVMREVFGVEWPGRAPTRLASYTLINVVIWWRVLLLFLGQRPRRGAYSPPSEPTSSNDGE